MSHDAGDEDDLATCPRRFWPIFRVGRTLYYQPLSWTHEHLPSLPDHDAGDEDHNAWLRPNSELTQARVYKRLFG
jgi:hypothetical protein